MAEDSVTILIVDDDSGHIELVRRNLRRAGVSNAIESISDGEGALDYVFRRGAHAARTSQLLVLLDLNIAGRIDGFEVLRRIKADGSTKRIPVIVLTTADDERDVDRCYDLGCNVYVTKPVDPAAFSESIERLALILSIASLPQGAEAVS